MAGSEASRMSKRLMAAETRPSIGAAKVTLGTDPGEGSG